VQKNNQVQKKQVKLKYNQVISCSSVFNRATIVHNSFCIIVQLWTVVQGGGEISCIAVHVTWHEAGNHSWNPCISRWPFRVASRASDVHDELSI